MQRYFIILSVVVMSLVWATSSRAAGLRAGDLIVGGGNTIRLVNPATGDSEIAFQADSFNNTVFDVAYNRVTNSAFFIAGGLTSPRNLMELRWSLDSGFTTSIVLSGLKGTESLGIDRQGNVLFDQEAFVDHDLWRLNRDGTTEMVSQPSFGTLFVPSDMEVSRDGALLYVSNVPTNNLEVYNLSNGRLISDVDLSWPEGLSITADGSILVAEGGPGDSLSDRISIIPPSGLKRTYAQQPWMEFLGSGFWGDIEYDDASGTLYAGKGSKLFAIDQNLVARQVVSDSFSFSVNGLDVISVPEPSTMFLLVSSALGLLMLYQYRRRPINGNDGQSSSHTCCKHRKQNPPLFEDPSLAKVAAAPVSIAICKPENVCVVRRLRQGSSSENGFPQGVYVLPWKKIDNRLRYQYHHPTRCGGCRKAHTVPGVAHP